MTKVLIFSGIGSVLPNQMDSINPKYIDYINYRSNKKLNETDHVVTYNVATLMTSFEQKTIEDYDYITSHSLGLLPALVAANAISWEECLDYAMQYDVVFQTIPKGKLSNVRDCVPMSMIKNQQIIACYNTPTNITIVSDKQDSNLPGRVVHNIPFHHPSIKKYFDQTYLIKGIVELSVSMIHNGRIIRRIDLMEMTKMFYDVVRFDQNIETILSIDPLTVFDENAPKPILIPMLLRWNKGLNVVDGTKIESLKQIHDYVEAKMTTRYGTFAPTDTFASLGMSSKDFVALITDIHNDLNIDISKVFFYKYPTLRRMMMGQRRGEDMMQSSITTPPQQSDIAINGIGLALPGANTVEEFWELIESGECVVGEKKGRRYAAGYMGDWVFDNNMFGIPASEAKSMDPQQKILLHTTYDALQDAGFDDPTQDLQGVDVGVFVGNWSQDFAVWGGESKSTFAATGRSNTILASRISYAFGLTGPCTVLDTACSSSIVALHYAIQSIRNGDCGSAIVAGVNLLLNEEMTDLMKQGGFLSPDFRCHVLSDKANGYVRSEGCVAIYIAKACASTPSYGTVAATALNQDGRSNGLTAPNPDSQVALVERCVAKAGIASSDISMVEMHGTGTKLGDPIEVTALSEVFGSHRVILGGAKSQVGHTEAAAGLVGLVKLVLCLGKRRVPKGVEIERLNPYIEWDRMMFDVPNKEYDLAEGAYGGVSSFGFGGTNSHAILRAPVAMKEMGNCSTSATKVARTFEISMERIDGHKLHQQTTYPAAGWLRELGSAKSIRFLKPLREDCVVDSGNNEYVVFEATNNRLRSDPRMADFDTRSVVGTTTHYATTEAHGLQYTNQFHCIEKVEFDKHHIIDYWNRFKITMKPSTTWNEGSIDAGLQPLTYYRSDTSFIPYYVESFVSRSKPSTIVAYIEGSVAFLNETSIQATLSYYDDQDKLIAQIINIEMRAFEPLPKHASWVHKIHTDQQTFASERSANERFANERFANERFANERFANERFDYAANGFKTLRSISDSNKSVVEFDNSLGQNGFLKTIAKESGIDLKMKYNQTIEPLSIVPGRFAYRVRKNALVAKPLYCAPLQEGQVRVRVEYVGVNFRDSLTVMGMYPGDPGCIGIDFAGFVEESTVEGFRPNDRVAGLAFGTYATHVVTDHRLLYHTEPTTDLRLAAALPLVSVTAVYCLGEVAKIRSGERVLIHAATGGVGLIATQYCLMIGAIPYCTVSTEAKRRHLVSLGVDPKNIRNSRTKEFASKDWVRSMDAVLNSIAFVEQTMECVKDGGRFVEIGKLTIVDSVERGIQYTPIAIDGLMLEDPDRLISTISALRTMQFKMPVRETSTPTQALKDIRGGCNIGKLVFRMNRTNMDRKKIVLVTGSTGSLGGEVVGYMEAHNYGVVRIGRKELQSIETLRECLNSVRSNGMMIVGIVHCAGCLDDATIANQTLEKFENVLFPKVIALQWLCEETKHDPLEHLVVFSSITSISGSPGQANYCYANDLANHIVRERNEAGMVGSSLCWGAWSEIGMGTASKHHFDKMGIGSLPTKDGIELFDHMMRYPIGVFAMADLSGYLSVRDGDRQKKQNISLDDVFMTVMGKEWLEQLQKKDSYKSLPLMDCGIDSLLSTEFKNEVSRSFDIELTATFLFDYPTIETIEALLRSASLRSALLRGSEEIVVDDDTKQPQQQHQQTIYITGMAGRFPGSDTIEGFWENIVSGKDCVDREQGIGRFVDRSLFDAQFFRMPKNEAIITDPAHRITLEVVHEAMVDAGLDHATEKDVGVFLGQCFQDYDIVAARTQTTGVYHSVANARSVLAGRISFHYDFKAPCMTIDTACSSSLVCLDLALMNMQQDRCSKALVGGVNVVIDPTTIDMFRTTNMLSPDFACKTFDDSANGYVRSEGCGIVVLSTEIPKNGAYAIVRGSGVNHDGRTATLTAPNGPSQEEVYHQTLRNASLGAEDVDVIECHGTGTPLGDPIEVNSLKNVYCKNDRTKPLYLGSVKSCIGHTEAAAGIAGVVKACLMLQQNMIAPVVHFNKLNHHIQLADCMQIPQTAVRLEEDSKLRNVAVSSFGFSGTNAHAILGQVLLEYKKVTITPTHEWKTKKRYWIDESASIPSSAASSGIKKKKKRVLQL